MTLNTILDNQLWEAHHLLKMAPGVMLDCRMTIIRLDDDTLLMHSPVPISEAMKQQIEDLPGTLKYVIAPSLFHHLFVRNAKEMCPSVHTFAAPGLPKKRPNFTFDTELSFDDNSSLPWHTHLQAIPLKGMPKVNEVLFYHHATKTLIVTDLLFNMHTIHGAMSPLIFRMFGTYKRLAQSRLVKTAISDKNAYLTSITPIKDLDIQRLIMAHGEVVEGPDTRSKVLQALGIS